MSKRHFGHRQEGPREFSRSIHRLLLDSSIWEKKKQYSSWFSTTFFYHLKTLNSPLEMTTVHIYRCHRYKCERWQDVKATQLHIFYMWAAIQPLMFWLKGKDAQTQPEHKNLKTWTDFALKQCTLRINHVKWDLIKVKMNSPKSMCQLTQLDFSVFQSSYIQFTEFALTIVWESFH